MGMSINAHWVMLYYGENNEGKEIPLGLKTKLSDLKNLVFVKAVSQQVAHCLSYKHVFVLLLLLLWRRWGKMGVTG